MREKRLEEGYNLYLNGYGVLLLEKRNYLFKNYKNVNSKLALFPGCNFPAYYPNTTRIISEKLKENFGISTIFDCCGKPIADLNMKKEDIRDRLYSRFKGLGIEELILLCPNCYYYFNNNLDIKVSMIYEHDHIMESLIYKNDSNSIEGLLFLPCPDKDSRTIYKMLERYVDYDKLQEITDIQCCGAGGCASIKEKDLAKKLQDGFKAFDEKIYVYCATCSGMITKSNGNVEHILCKLLNTNEKISTGISTVKNRALFSIKK